jgi:hypothetical protein
MVVRADEALRLSRGSEETDVHEPSNGRVGLETVKDKEREHRAVVTHEQVLAHVTVPQAQVVGAQTGDKGAGTTVPGRLGSGDVRVTLDELRRLRELSAERGLGGVVQLDRAAPMLVPVLQPRETLVVDRPRSTVAVVLAGTRRGCTSRASVCAVARTRVVAGTRMRAPR